MSEPQNTPAEWPTREQMEHVQRWAADGTSVKVERHVPMVDGDMRLTVGTSKKYVYNVDGEDVTDIVLAPTAAEGISIPLDLLRMVLGEEMVQEAVDASRGRDLPGYTIGHHVAEAFIGRVTHIVSEHAEAGAETL